MAKQREIKDMPHEYLVHRVALLEEYLASMLQMMIHHHPYLGPHAQQIGNEFQKRTDMIEEQFPVSAIITPINGIIKTH